MTSIASAIETEARTTYLVEDRRSGGSRFACSRASRRTFSARRFRANSPSAAILLIASSKTFCDVTEEGGRATVIRGAYGQGKTFTLKLLEETALAQGYMTARVEIDSAENCLSKPWQVVRELLSNLRLPDEEKVGARALAERARELVRRSDDRDTTSKRQDAQADFERLKGELECPPLAWLLADPDLIDKPELLGLLACDPVASVADARKVHVLKLGAEIWPAFNASTQGDFASFLLSGLGRLSRCLDFKGFIVILDEMERWQDLNWTEQCQASNWLGGLIWGAVAEQG